MATFCCMFSLYQLQIEISHPYELTIIIKSSDITKMTLLRKEQVVRSYTEYMRLLYERLNPWQVL